MIDTRAFLIIGNKAVTSPFKLNNLPGAGRVDILCRCISSALFISHNIRRDVEVYLLLLGEPDPPKALKICGAKLRYMSPDERNIAGLLRKSLSVKVDKDWKETSPGIYISRKGLDELLKEFEDFSIYYLREDGRDIREIEFYGKCLFILGDHMGVKKEMEEKILGDVKEIIGIPTLSLQAEHCITIVNYELDRKIILSK